MAWEQVAAEVRPDHRRAASEQAVRVRLLLEAVLDDELADDVRDAQLAGYDLEPAAARATFVADVRDVEPLGFELDRAFVLELDRRGRGVAREVDVEVRR